MDDWELKLPWTRCSKALSEPLLEQEWLVTNGLGGYASGTVAGAASRRFHGLLIAALPTPLGRQMMFNHLSELVRLTDGTTALLGGEERVGGVLDIHAAEYLTEFRLDTGLPVWRYEIGDAVLEKRILLSHGQNTVFIQYQQLAGDGPIRLKLRPALHFRPHEGRVSDQRAEPYTVRACEYRYEIQGPPALPPLRMYLYGERSAFTVDGQAVPDLRYRVEESRGYDAEGGLWAPGYFRVDLHPGRPATLVASTEPWDAFLSLTPEEAFDAERERRRRLIAAAHPAARSGPAQELVLAADQFIITPTGRVEDAARARAAGDEIRTVIAGYHWFTDWGRDTMISLEGLTLTSGRHREAGCIIRTFAHYIRDGLLPNLFPEGEKEGLYHTADATLWFFQAIHRYLTVTGDRFTLGMLLPKLHDIVRHHLVGTHFGIGVDPADGLLKQGAPGYQLTWMDAKVGDWVVTPRRGKAVEINALWYNALRLLEGWTRQAQDAGKLEAGLLSADELARHAERAQQSFNQRFWYESGQYLYDVIDGEAGNDTACRPNQVLSIALKHPVLATDRWAAVLDTVQQRLLTPVGLRSLAPGHPDYKAKYYGDLRARDAAYHQGTVWAWLIGPFVDAWLKLHPNDRAGARRFLQGFIAHLGEAAIGSVSEIFDAEQPFTPRGCVAQAWSVAEVLRCWVKTAEEG
ncbi:MAG: glycogen debranching enzyme family protein [Planctomycetia bacterium]|nr:glycogen debranching enzyme family protein [Planctomycetia bacterium]